MSGQEVQFRSIDNADLEEALTVRSRPLVSTLLDAPAINQAARNLNVQANSLREQDLAEGLTRRSRPAPAYIAPSDPPTGFQFPLDLDVLRPTTPEERRNPNYQPRVSQAEAMYSRSEEIRRQQWAREQTQAAQAREAEITRRSQEQRDEIRRRMAPAEPPISEPRVTNRRSEWEDPPRSRPQSTPAPATPPPTPSTSGAAAQVTYADPPPPAAVRSPLPANPSPQAMPNSLPSPAGRLAGPVIGGVADLGFRIGAGQPAGQAAFGAGGAVAGGIAGAGFGALAGPGGSVVGAIGGFVGGLIGGYGGGRLADYIYNLAFPPSASPETRPPDPVVGPSPFTGGQCVGVKYRIFYGIDSPGGRYRYGPSEVAEVWGPVNVIKFVAGPFNGGHGVVVSRGPANGPCLSAPSEYVFVYHGGDSSDCFLSHQAVIRSDGQPDNCGNPAGPAPASDRRNLDSTYHPGNQNFAPSSAMPNAGNSPVSALNNYAPGGFNSRAGGTPQGNSPNWVPHGGPAGTPPPDFVPSVLPPPLPFFGPSPTSGNSVSGGGSASGSGSASSDGSASGSGSASSDGSASGSGSASSSDSPSGSGGLLTGPSPLANPRTNPSDQSFPTFTPAFTPNPLPTPQPFTPQPLTPSPLGNPTFFAEPRPDWATPSAVPQTNRSTLAPDSTSTISRNQAPPQPTTPEERRFNQTQTEMQELRTRLDQALIALAGATTVLNQLPRNIQKTVDQTAPQALRDAARNGTCDTLQPGGCLLPIANNAQNAANNSQANGNILNGANLAANAANNTILNTLVERVGPQVPGGISGFLQRFAKSIHLDKIINALTLITALHNAAMLSRSLGSTLGDLTGQALSVIGLKDEDGADININQIIGRQVNNLFETILGKEVWTGIKTSWNKASAIISSATQIVSTVRSLFDSAKEILEWTAENTGKIGNALRKFRVVGENAYRWMPERMTATNKWAEKVNRAREGTESLDDAASSLSGVLGEVQSIQQEYAELQEQKQKFDNNLKAFTPKEREDNTPVKQAAEASKAASIAPANAADVFRGEGESGGA